MKKKIICWWSGGVTSAVAIYLTIQLFGKENIRIIFIDTFNEHVDTYRFKDDCQKWYGIEIETITGIGKEYKRIQDVWFAYKSLNVATGAICSYRLKGSLEKNGSRKTVLISFIKFLDLIFQNQKELWEW